MNTCPSVLMMNLTKIANKVLGGQACQACLHDGGARVHGAGRRHSLVTRASQPASCCYRKTYTKVLQLPLSGSFQSLQIPRSTLKVPRGHSQLTLQTPQSAPVQWKPLCLG